jgi:hypothetical protein
MGWYGSMRVWNRMDGVPGVGDDDVVEGGVLLAEAGEADLKDHGRWEEGGGCALRPRPWLD